MAVDRCSSERTGYVTPALPRRNMFQSSKISVDGPIWHLNPPTTLEASRKDICYLDRGIIR